MTAVDTTQVAAPPADSAILCVSCGYDLRGLAEDANCPECGESVERSLHGNLLRYANPDWLKAIARGQLALKWGVWLVAAYIPLLIMVIITFGFILAGKVSVVYENTAMYALTGLLLIGLIVGAIGALFITQAEPSAADREVSTSARIVSRYGVIVAIVAGSIYAGLNALTNLSTTQIVRQSGWAVVAILVALASAALFRRQGELARRIPDAILEKRFRRHFKYVIWSVPALFIASIFIQPGGRMTAITTWISAALGIVGLIAGCAVLVLLVELCKTMRLMQGRLRDCVELSPRAAVPAPPIAES